MGAVLVHSAFSANIKERRDCSTALFDTSGRMIAQAEHIPLHHVAERCVAELCERRGRQVVVAAMASLYDYAERRMRSGIEALPDGRYEAQDVLEAADRDLDLHVAVTIAGDEIDVDFDGTALKHEGNLNCPLAVTRSACYFVVRALVDPDLPASGGP